MLEESAMVVEVRGGMLWVEALSRSACSHCASGSCTTSVISKLFGIRRNRLHLENSLGAKPGEQVVIGMPDDLLVKAAVRAYLLPLLVMLAAAALGDALGIGDGFQSLLALIGLSFGMVFVRWSTRGAQRFKPQLLRIAGRGRARVEIPNLTRN